jgi:hypothetical protein
MPGVEALLVGDAWHRQQSPAPLSDHSDASIRAAGAFATRAALQRAADMGLPWVQFRGAQVGEDQVIVQLLATDQKPEDDDEDDGPVDPGRGGPSRITS